MKKHQLFTAILSAVFLMASCGGSGNDHDMEVEKDLDTDVDNLETTVPRICRLKSYKYMLGDEPRTLNFSYENGKLSSVETVTGDTTHHQSIEYTYNPDGSLSSYEIEGGKAIYVYDEENRLIEITGEGSFNTRKFEYDDNGNISSQITYFGRKPYTTHIYSYDHGAPVKVSIYDNKGELMEENMIRYDQNMNPLIGKGIATNVTEMIYGYPVANYTHNIVGVTRTFTKKSAYQIDGKYKMPGDTDTLIRKYEYDNEGHPIAVVFEDGKKKFKSEYIYECD